MLVPLLILSMQASPAAEPHHRGSDLYASCVADVKMMDDESYYDPSAARCLYYIDGFIDGLMVNEVSGRRSLVCLTTYTYGTVARVYVKYMQEHPKAMDQDKAVGFLFALREAYPCKTK
jgi:hypothetical protein